MIWGKRWRNRGSISLWLPLGQSLGRRQPQLKHDSTFSPSILFQPSVPREPNTRRNMGIATSLRRKQWSAEGLMTGGRVNSDCGFLCTRFENEVDLHVSEENFKEANASWRTIWKILLTWGMSCVYMPINLSMYIKLHIYVDIHIHTHSCWLTQWENLHFVLSPVGGIDMVRSLAAEGWWEGPAHAAGRDLITVPPKVIYPTPPSILP